MNICFLNTMMLRGEFFIGLFAGYHTCKPYSNGPCEGKGQPAHVHSSSSTCQVPVSANFEHRNLS